MRLGISQSFGYGNSHLRAAMRGLHFGEVSRWSALALFATAIASAQQVSQGPSPPGMVWIPGGEFSMGAATNGGGSCEMPMASNDAEPVHRVFVDGFWMDT